VLRRFVIGVLRFALRVFFRRIEVVGVERVPAGGPVVFVLNHPNGLVDPAFLFCFAPRRVSFLAKSPLFHMPVVGFLIRQMEAIPVYRQQDEGADTSRNRETFERSHALLRRGGTIAICPEGKSHSEPNLQPLKTGAARIALGAASVAGGEGAAAARLRIVPAGLYYTAKTTFRSGALLYFGEPLEVEPAALDETGEPPRAAVRELSDRIADALRALTLNADRHEALAVVARAERIFSSGEDETEEGDSLARELRRRRRFVEGYAFHRERSPERLAELERRIHQYEEELLQVGIEDPRQLSTEAVARHARPFHLLTRGLLFALLSPLALAGTLAHYPAYTLAGVLATRLSQNYDDVLSTFKIMAAMLLFPATWLALAALSYFYAGWWGVAAALLAAPLAGYAALRTREEFDRFVGGTRAFLFFVTSRRFFRQLLDERRAIRREILALGDEAERAAAAEASR
jgi:glycerol-3-phosphate O-acyltransferase/dihydroxyacetone phosphate acyltransferase